MIELQDLLPRRDRAFPVRELLRVGAREGHAVQAVRRKTAHRPLRRAEVIEGLEESGDVEAENAGHQHGYREDDRCGVDGEPRVVKESVEHDSDAFAAADDAEAVKSYDKVH